MKRSGIIQHQLQISDLETETNQESVFEQFTKFVQFWKDGRKASFNVECDNGEAVMNLSVSLKSSRKTRHSPSRIRRNKKRAEKHRKKQQQEFNAEQLQEKNDVDNEDSLDIDSDFNGNEVNNFHSLDYEYQLCFVNDDDYSDVFSLDSNAQRQDLETELFGTEEEVIGNEDDTDEVNKNDEESEPLGDDETSSADGCTAGPMCISIKRNG